MKWWHHDTHSPDAKPPNILLKNLKMLHGIGVSFSQSFREVPFILPELANLSQQIDWEDWIFFFVFRFVGDVFLKLPTPESTRSWCKFPLSETLWFFMKWLDPGCWVSWVSCSTPRPMVRGDFRDSSLASRVASTQVGLLPYKAL